TSGPQHVEAMVRRDAEQEGARRRVAAEARAVAVHAQEDLLARLLGVGVAPEERATASEHQVAVLAVQTLDVDGHGPSEPGLYPNRATARRGHREVTGQ